MEVCAWVWAGLNKGYRCIQRALGRVFMPAMLAILSAGCATVGQVTNFSQPACAEEFHQGLGAILVEQGESAGTSDTLAERTVSSLTGGAFGPRPFLVSSPSGTDYEFFVQKKPDACLLRLYGRYHGFVSYTNNLTYIATRQLVRCECTE